MKKLLFGAVLVCATLFLVDVSSNKSFAADNVQNPNIAAIDSSSDTDKTYGTEKADSKDITKNKEGHSGVRHFGTVFAMLALVLVVGKLGNFVEKGKYGVPSVIGELLAGVALGAAGYYGWGFIDEIIANNIIAYLAQFGALLLLFSIGLESNLKEMRKVGTRALYVAIIGVVVPFLIGTMVVAPLFFPDATSNARFFVGASLVATSVGITAAVFRSLKLTKSRAAQTVIGAAVIDDVLGLMILAMVSALATGGELTAGLVAELTLKSFGFLVGSIALGMIAAQPISRFFSMISDGIGMKLSLAVGFALLFGYLAELFGLEPIIGAFAAGLLLDAVHFERFSEPEIIKEIKHLESDEMVAAVIKRHRHGHIEDLINNLGYIFIPVFFVYTGMQIDFGSLLQPRLYIIATAIALLAIAAKWVAGLAAPGSKNEKLLVGVSMVPRGEVGLIFAATGASLGVLTSEMFSTIVLVVIITTFIAPPLIKKYGMALKQEEKLLRAQKKAAAK